MHFGEAKTPCGDIFVLSVHTFPQVNVFRGQGHCEAQAGDAGGLCVCSGD